jgi:hypothetical protein
MRGMVALGIFATTLSTAVPVASDDAEPAVSLRGSPAAMEQQHRVAREHGLDFYRTRAEILEAVARGDLVELPGNENYEVADFVDLRYAQPEARLFVERTAALYHAACGEPLVVTSAVRAIDEQPPNAHALSVHPAGMAIDLRVSQNEACRDWLEAKMLSLETDRLVNGIREFRPPHYHVAVFPEPYAAYVAAQPTPIPGVEEEEPAIVPTEVEERRTALWAWIIALVVAGLAAGWALRRAVRTPSSKADPKL